MSELAVSTYTGLGRTALPRLLEDLADAGLSLVEILASRPHVDLEDPAATVDELRPVLAQTGQRVSSVVASGVDVNLASTQPSMRRWSSEQFLATVRIAAALGADFVIVHPGRRHPLRPPPMQSLRTWVLQGLETVLDVADREGVRVLLENVPTGLLDTASECADVVKEFGGQIGLCYDIANGFMVEDVPRALASLGEELCLVHASDTRRSEWLHDPLGTAEVPWPVVTAALAKKAYTGRVVLETLHEGDPVRGFAADAAVWASAGGGGGSSRSGDGS